MDSSSCKISPMIIYALVLFHYFFISPVCSAQSVNSNNTKHNFRPRDELKRLKHIRAYLKKINKPYVKTIQSPDGDIIDCVPTHLQPAFDHPLLKGQMPIMHPPELPDGHNTSRAEIFQESFQIWRMSGESCPENTIPIRRITEQDVLRSSSVNSFRRKSMPVKKDSSVDGHEYAVGYSKGTYYGAQAIVNLWDPQVEDPSDFSLSQIWVTAGSHSELNSIEVGWQVFPQHYSDNFPRLFIYWTSDGYQTTGCYNLECSGFVQTNNNMALGTPIGPISSYNDSQFDIPFSVYKNQTDGNWWLQVNGVSVGYWPSILFTHLNDHASIVQFGGEILNSESSGTHTSTQMGSGHFADEGFGKASYFRNIQVIDSANKLITVPYLTFRVDRPTCYNESGGWLNKVWGAFFFYGGPGRNIKCT